MFHDLIPWLRCPRSDGGELALEDARPGGGRVQTGMLRCARCDSTYAIRDGVPALLTELLRADLPELDHHSTFSSAEFERAGYRVHGCIGWVSRERFRVGPPWDAYDDIAWHLPQIGGTLVAVRRGTGSATERVR